MMLMLMECNANMGAKHLGCYTMSLRYVLGNEGRELEEIETTVVPLA
jgi:hypothetical protein